MLFPTGIRLGRAQNFITPNSPMSKFSSIRYPNRRERRNAYTTSSFTRILNASLKKMNTYGVLSDMIYKATPILSWIKDVDVAVKPPLPASRTSVGGVNE